MSAKTHPPNRRIPGRVTALFSLALTCACALEVEPADELEPRKVPLTAGGPVIFEEPEVPCDPELSHNVHAQQCADGIFETCHVELPDEGTDDGGSAGDTDVDCFLFVCKGGPQLEACPGHMDEGRCEPEDPDDCWKWKMPAPSAAP